MFEKITKMLEDRMHRNETTPDGFEHRHIAVVALLIEAARKDGHYDEVEHQAIARLIRDHFQFPANRTAALMAVAERRERLVWNSWIFCEQVKRGFSLEERQSIIGDLWTLVASDQSLHRLETQMIETIAFEIGLTKDQSSALRDQARKAMGIA